MDEQQRRDLERWKKGPRGFLPKANRVIDALNELKGRPGPPRQVFTTRKVTGGWNNLVLVVLTEHAVITAANKSITVNGGSAVTVETAWTYGGNEAALVVASMTHAVVSGGRTFYATPNGSGQQSIYNPAEANATTAIVGGITMNTSNYPLGHRPRPLDASGTSNTHSHNPLVWVTLRADSAGTLRWMIVGRVAPLHDGSCT